MADDMVERIRAELTAYRLVYVSRDEVLVMLRAMAEPASAMLGMGGSAVESAPVETDDIELANKAWQAMIKAAITNE